MNKKNSIMRLIVIVCILLSVSGCNLLNNIFPSLIENESNQSDFYQKNCIIMSTGMNRTIFAIMDDGSLYGWGGGNINNPALGLGNNYDYQIPTRIGTLKWNCIATAANDTAGIQSDGSLWIWGQNGLIDFGFGDKMSRSVPTRYGSENDWKVVFGGLFCFYAIKNDGTLWVVGDNNYGQLGITGLTSIDKFTQVDDTTNWKYIVGDANGTGFSFGLKNNGTLWATGKNEQGYLGLGDTIPRDIWTQVGNESDWLRISSNGGRVLATKSNGTLWHWGVIENNSIFISSPTQVGTDSDWSIPCGSPVLLASKKDGSVWVWGFGDEMYVFLGFGVSINIPEPTKLESIKNCIAIYSSLDSTFVISNDGSIWAWGSNAFGQLGERSDQKYPFKFK